MNQSGEFHGHLAPTRLLLPKTWTPEKKNFTTLKLYDGVNILIGTISLAFFCGLFIYLDMLLNFGQIKPKQSTSMLLAVSEKVWMFLLFG